MFLRIYNTSTKNMFMWAFENTVLENSKKTIRIKSPYHFYNFPEIFDKISVVFFD